ncbi:MAG TPA: universal stress protein [Terriglobia bacterium]|nr:universal stress protein [Terriglobia bacterium]
MSRGERGLAIRRILVALDSSRHSLAALEAAAELAAHTEAELFGLFVEDINLLRLARLPFASQVSATSAAAESVDPERMERELRGQAAQARRALAAVAERARVPWSFRVARGEVVAELIAAAEEVDLITLGKRGLASNGQRLGSTAHAALSNVRRSLLLSQHGSPFRPPVLAVYDGSEGSRQALDIGLRLACTAGHELVVLLVDGTGAAPAELQEAVARETGSHGPHVRYQGSYAANALSLSNALRGEPEGLLVLSNAGRLSRDEIRKLSQQVRNSVLVVAGAR